MRGVIVALTLAASLLGALSPAAWARTLGYPLDPWQAECLESDHRAELLNVTRQGGKSTTGGLKAAHAACYGADGFTAIVAGPSERQGIELLRKVAEPLHKALPPAEFVGEGATHITLTRDRRVLAVPAVERTVRAFTLDLLLLDEAARVPDDFYGAVRPMLAIRKGKLLALSTPFGQRGWFYQEWMHGGADFKRYEVPWTQCPRMDAAFIERERASAQRRGLEPDAWIAQEYGCSFAAAIPGAYYARLLEEARRAGRIRPVPYDATLEVQTAWDLGVGDATAIWFVQLAGREIRVIDYYEASGVGLDHYAQVLKSKPYAYGRHIAPHDIEVTEFGSGLTRREQAAKLGIRFEVAPQQSVSDGINAVRALLPRCYFDATACARGLNALSYYHAVYDEERLVLAPKPEHDWSSHAADAFRYFAVAFREPTAPTPQAYADPGRSFWAQREAHYRQQAHAVRD